MRAWMLGVALALLVLSAAVPPARGSADCDVRALDGDGVLAAGCGEDGTWVWVGVIYDCGSGTSLVYVGTSCD